MAKSQALQAVVFDLWDTLIPFPKQTERDALQAMAEELGVPVDGFARAWSNSFPNRALGWSTRQALGAIYPSATAKMSASIDLAAERRYAILSELIHPDPRTLSVIAELRRRGLLIGLLSDCGPESAELVRKSDLAPLLDAAIFSCEVGATKPSPRLYWRIAAALGVSPRTTLYVGDRPDELSGARDVSMTPVMLLGPMGRQTWSGRAIKSLDRLPTLIARLQKAAGQ